MGELNCQELDRCHSTAVIAYQHHVNKTEILLEKWNVETAALQKILCYCNVWLSDMDDCDNRSQHNATQFDVCKDQSCSPDAVDHGTPALKASCPLKSVTRGRVASIKSTAASTTLLRLFLPVGSRQ